MIFLSVCFCSKAQYNVKSEHILNPDLNIEYVRNNAEFWIRNAYDPEYGGFFSNVDQYGNVTTMIPQRPGFGNTPYKRKSLIAQSRHGYGFTRAFMLTGDERYLTYAKSALDFLFDHGWDTKHEGWFCFAKSDGTLDITQYDLRDLNEKWSFQQHYALLGPIAHYEATRDSRSEEFMNKGINTIYTKMWDSRENYKGYYETADVDWSNKHNKGFTSTIDAITTNAELSYLITQEDKYKTRLLELADIIVERFIPQMDNSSVKVLYPEIYNTNWVVDLNASKKGYVGHFIKTAWCLGRAYLCDTTKNKYKKEAIKILNEVWNYHNGDVSLWDHTNGGPFNEINILTGEWDSNNGNLKDYWTVEQGFTGPMINYYITKDETFLRMADEALKFFMDHFVDSEYGEIFYHLDASGTVVKRGIKGDGNDFTIFDAATRTLTLAPNQGGKFKVVFERTLKTPSALARNVRGSNIKIFPNPVSTTLYIKSSEYIAEISIYDLAGKRIVSSKLNGQYSSINISHLSKGIYCVVLSEKSGSTTTHRIIKQ
jgi:mannose/cellobiose epimerase-like protein (N-acyl-D-glucosamine 2-epimerase family)